MVSRYFIIYKPYGMLSQFTTGHGHKVLGDLYKFPKDVYPVGRLDTDSEGLLLLTNDKKINHLLLDPGKGHKRIYIAQLEGEVTPSAVKMLEKGISIRIKSGDYTTLPAKVKRISSPAKLPERVPPVRARKNIPVSWIKLALAEGKNRQVRKMCAVAGFPVLRLVRIAIEDLFIGEMIPGDVMELKKEAVYRKLKLFPG